MKLNEYSQSLKRDIARKYAKNSESCSRMKIALRNAHEASHPVDEVSG
jgi:hypothetical protein